MTLKGKNIVLGVCGSIAAYKACDIIRGLVKLEANVDCIMTKNALEFITPITLQTLSKNKVYKDLFDDPSDWKIEHISLSKKADIILIAPATADTIAKLAVGRADDLLSSTILASKSKILICPAMNTNMYNHKATQKNIQTLKEFGYKFVAPQKGELACGDCGDGRLADVKTIVDEVVKELS